MLHGVTARSGSGGANGVRRGDQKRLRTTVVIVVVLTDSRAYICGGLVPRRNVRADFGMRSVDLMSQCLADVVQKTASGGDLDVRPYLPGHHSSESGDLDAVLKNILAIAESVFEPTQQLH